MSTSGARTPALGSIARQLDWNSLLLLPGLALVDLDLRVMSGFELARHVRQYCDNAMTRLVASSGYGQDSDIQAALEAGFDEHVPSHPTPSGSSSCWLGAGTIGAERLPESRAADAL
jgi:CheY-like chemotaxis protein